MQWLLAAAVNRCCSIPDMTALRWISAGENKFTMSLLCNWPLLQDLNDFHSQKG